jgi:CHAT domain-containing protein/Tfp pilus assembly protein PilF
MLSNNYTLLFLKLKQAFTYLVLVLLAISCNKNPGTDSTNNPKSRIVTRSQTDLSGLAEQFHQSFEYDSAFKYYNLSLSNYKKANNWEKYILTLISMADIERMRSNGSNARELIQSAENTLQEKLNTNKSLLADIKHKQGVLLMDKGNYDSALIILNTSIETRIQANGSEDTLLAMTYNATGNIYFHTRKYQQAISAYTRAYELELKRKTPNDADLAMFIQNTAIIHAQEGNYEKASEAFSRSIEINERILKPDDPAMAMPFLNMGRLLILAYKDNEALSYYNRAENILTSRLGNEHIDLSSLYMNKGQIYVHLADYEKALSYFRKALSIAEKNFDKGHALILSLNMNIGYVLEKKREFLNALQYYEASIPADENDPAGIKTYMNMASLYSAMDEPEKAAAFYKKSIALADRLLGTNHPETALLYTRYGYFQLSNNLDDLGYQMFVRALESSIANYGKESREVSNNFVHLGHYYLATLKQKQALSHFQSAINALISSYQSSDIATNPAEKDLIPDRYLINALNGKANALFILAKANGDIPSLKHSLETYKLSVKVVEKLRSMYQNEESKLQISEDERKTYLDAVKVATELYKLTKDTFFAEEAFKYADKGKSAVLLASMMDVEARQFGKIPENILRLENKLKLDMSSYARYIYEEQLKPEPSVEKIRLWESLAFDLEGRYDSLIKVLERVYPDYYSLKYKEPILDIENIKKNLEPGRTLIEYSVTDTMLYIFVLNREKFEVIEHKIRNDFRENIRTLTLSTTTTDFMSIRKSDYLQYVNAAHSLYLDLLDPVKNIIDDKKLIIIPDAEIGYISFDMLLTSQADTTTMNFRNLPFLIYDHIISYSASAALQYSNLQKTTRRPVKNLLAMAPSYQNLTNLEEDGFVDETGNTVYLLPIPGVEDEIREIRKVLTGRSLKGEMATERSFKEVASDYNILHFAMHTLINNEKPMLSKLVFYQDADSTEDGMLNTYELFGMELNAGLAVLSACNTGTGKLLKGEGIMNLARGFVYAGVPSIVMTMWSVEDQSSAQIVNSFYQYLDKGMPKDEALRQAKLDMLAEGNMLRSHPYYWAAYVNIGDYSPMKLIKPLWLNIFYFVIALASIISILSVFARKRSYALKVEADSLPPSAD